jgi:hypothetical protein
MATAPTLTATQFARSCTKLALIRCTSSDTSAALLDLLRGELPTNVEQACAEHYTTYAAACMEHERDVVVDAAVAAVLALVT